MTAWLRALSAAWPRLTLTLSEDDEWDDGDLQSSQFWQAGVCLADIAYGPILHLSGPVRPLTAHCITPGWLWHAYGTPWPPGIARRVASSGWLARRLRDLPACGGWQVLSSGRVPPPVPDVAINLSDRVCIEIVDDGCMLHRGIRHDSFVEHSEWRSHLEISTVYPNIQPMIDTIGRTCSAERGSITTDQVAFQDFDDVMIPF